MTNCMSADGASDLRVGYMRAKCWRIDSSPSSKTPQGQRPLKTARRRSGSVGWPSSLTTADEAATPTKIHGQNPGMDKRGHVPHPWKCCKSVFVLQMLSKISVDEVFMQYFTNMSSAFAGLPQTPIEALLLDHNSDFSALQTPHCPPLEKSHRRQCPNQLSLLFVALSCSLFVAKQSLTSVAHRCTRGSLTTTSPEGLLQ